MKRLSLFLALFAVGTLTAGRAGAQIKTLPLEYEIGGQSFEGYIARPELPSGDKQPGVLVVHDWTGHNPFARRQAENLAKLGYVALAVDLYGKGIHAADPGEAGKLAAPFYEDRGLFRARMAAALDVLKTQPDVDADRLGAMGFCFGGTAVLELARLGADVKGVVSFHGGIAPADPPDASKVRCRILVLHGTFDPHVPPADVAAFMQEMNAAKVHYKFVGYPNAVHAFTNPEAGNDPSQGAAYAPEAAHASFSEMKRFFTGLFTPATSLPPDTAMRSARP